MVPCWASCPLQVLDPFVPFRQSDRQSILFLMTLLPEEGVGSEGS